MELLPTGGKNILFIVKIAQDLKIAHVFYTLFLLLFVLHTNLPTIHKWNFDLLCRMDGVIVPLVPITVHFIGSRSVNR